MKINAFFKKYFDVNLTIILVGFYLITIVFNLIKVLSLAYINGNKYQVGINFYPELLIIDAIVVLIIMQLIAMHTKKLILNHTSWKRIMLYHFFIAIFIGVIILGITDVYKIHIGIYQTFDFKRSLRNFLSVLDINFLVYFAMLFIIYTYYYFDIIRANEVQQNQLQAQLMTTKMNLLKTQLQPHFLFNTINCIIGLIDIDKLKAQDTLVDLSSLLRELTKISDINLHPLHQELKILNHYIEILNVRFSDQLHFTIDMDESILNEEVPTMLFQPLIENAINHGFENSQGLFLIKITGVKEDNFLKFTVENNGPKLNKNSKTKQTGIGISNLEQRIKTIYGNDASFELRNKSDEAGVENVILLPFNN